jgi:hypothetical protein
LAEKDLNIDGLKNDEWRRGIGRPEAGDRKPEAGDRNN